MSDYPEFDHFDPKAESPPFYPFKSLPIIVSRAGDILLNRSHDEIVAAASIIDRTIEAFFEEEEESVTPDQLPNNNWTRKYLFEGHSDTDPNEYYNLWESSDMVLELDLAKQCIGYYNVEDNGFKDAKKQEYFAVLALRFVGKCLNWMQYDKEKNEENNLSLAVASAIHAMDAVCHAEQIKEEEQYLDIIQKFRIEFQRTEGDIDALAEKKAAERRKASGRKALDARHAENRAMRKQAIQYYEEHEAKFRSTEAAARYIASELVPVTPRTVVEWIRVFKKQRSAGKL